MTGAVRDFLESLGRARLLGESIAHREDIAARPPRWGPFPEGLGPEVERGLSRSGIGRLYSHQSEAVAVALHQLEAQGGRIGSGGSLISAETRSLRASSSPGSGSRLRTT